MLKKPPKNASLTCENTAGNFYSLNVLKKHLDNYYKWNTSWSSDFKKLYQRSGKNPKNFLDMLSNLTPKPKKGLCARLLANMEYAESLENFAKDLEKKTEEKEIKNKKDYDQLIKDEGRCGIKTPAKKLAIARLKFYLKSNPKPGYMQGEIWNLAALHEFGHIDLKNDNCLEEISEQRKIWWDPKVLVFKKLNDKKQKKILEALAAEKEDALEYERNSLRVSSNEVLKGEDSTYYIANTVPQEFARYCSLEEFGCRLFMKLSNKYTTVNFKKDIVKHMIKIFC